MQAAVALDTTQQSVFWFRVCGLWFVVCGLWFVVCGLWFVVCGLGFVVQVHTQMSVCGCA